MKAQLFLLTACLSLAADLGVISPRHGILLNTQTTRPDFQHFRVELKPADTTNVVTLTITNVLLTIDDMAALPSGRTVMGLRSYFWDGSISDLVIYTFDLRRADPPAPSAVRAALSAGSEPPKSLINEMERLRVPVPSPPLPSGRYFSTNIAGQRSTNLADYASPPVTWNPADYTNQETYGRVSTDIHIKFFDDSKGTWVGPTPEESHNMATNLNYCWYRLATNVNCQSTNHDHEVVGYGEPFKLKAQPLQSPRPLPGATNQTYAEYLDWLADRKGKRRNE